MAAWLFTACAGAAPMPQLVVQALAVQSKQAAPDVKQRGQQFTLSAALALPFEQRLDRDRPVRVDRLGDEITSGIPPDEAIRGIGPDGSDRGIPPDVAIRGVSLEDVGLALGPLAANSSEYSVPSSRALQQPSAATAAVIEPYPPALAQWTGGDTLGRSRRDEAEASEGADEPTAARLDPGTAQRLAARYAREPTALQVARAAISAAEQDPQRFASMIRRARWRGLVPDVTLGARRGQGVDLRTMVTQDETVRFTSGDDLVLSATLRFELGRLLFAPEEIAIAREARAARSTRLEIVQDVIHWYAIRRRLMLERDLLGYTSLAREARITELEALLDVFTSGAFGRMIADQRSWTTGDDTRGSKRP